MANLPTSSTLSKRYYYYDNESTWHSAGRWAVLGVFVGLFVIFMLFFLWACITARRRRRRGAAPIRGTAWTQKIPGIREAPAGTFDPPKGPPPSAGEVSGPPPETAERKAEPV